MKPRALGAGEGMRMQTHTDLDVYRKLSAIAEELERMATEDASLISQTALSTAAMSLRGVASAIYEHSISTDE
jgi:hypothetical protein